MSTLPTSAGRTAPGRPREFDADQALDAALAVFWAHGYAATSLDDLTAAMGISRSSLYACFSSKHDILIAAVRRYADQSFERLSAIASRETDPRQAALAVINTIADASGGGKGCFMVNCLTELAPDDPDILALGQAQIDRLEKLIAQHLKRANPNSAPSQTTNLARALLSTAFGATLLRKSGLPPAKINSMIAAAFALANDTS